MWSTQLRLQAHRMVGGTMLAWFDASDVGLILYWFGSFIRAVLFAWLVLTIACIAAVTKDIGGVVLMASAAKLCAVLG